MSHPAYENVVGTPLAAAAAAAVVGHMLAILDIQTPRHQVRDQYTLRTFPYSL